MKKPRQCPCCKNKEVSSFPSKVVVNAVFWTVECDKCGLSMTKLSEKDALDAWNRRK